MFEGLPNLVSGRLFRDDERTWKIQRGYSWGMSPLSAHVGGWWCDLSRDSGLKCPDGELGPVVHGARANQRIGKSR